VNRIFGLGRDEFEDVHHKVIDGLAGSDLVILSGGSSVGARDVAAKVLAQLGPPGVLVHGWHCARENHC